MSTRTERMSDKAGNDRNAKILKELMARPDNRRCADCRKKDPRWASWNLGIFFCIRCSGHHRNLGTHISKVKSADLDTWTEEQIANMVRWGNGKANQYWEQQLPPDFTPPESSIDQFIRAKYERKQYAMKGPVPDPATLRPVEGAAPTTTSVAHVTRTSPPMARLAKPGPVANQPSFANFAPPPSGAASAAKSSVPAATQPQQSHQQQQQQQQAPQSAAQQLFDVFSGSPSGTGAAATTSSGTTTSPVKDVKSSILSLYGQQPTPSSIPQQQQMNGLGGMSALGGMSQFGGGFAQQPPQHPQSQPFQQQQGQSGGFPASFGAFGQPSSPAGGSTAAVPSYSSTGQPNAASSSSSSSFAGFGTQPQSQSLFQGFPTQGSSPAQQQQQHQQPNNNQFQNLFTTTPSPTPAPSIQQNNSFGQQSSSGIPDFAGFGTGTPAAAMSPNTNMTTTTAPIPPAALTVNPWGQPPTQQQQQSGGTDDWGAFH